MKETSHVAPILIVDQSEQDQWKALKKRQFFLWNRHGGDSQPLGHPDVV